MHKFKFLSVVCLFLLSLTPVIFAKPVGEFNSVDELIEATEKRGRNYIYNNGQFINKQKQLNKSITDLDRLIELNPNNAKYWLARGLCYNLFISINNQTVWKDLSREEYFAHPRFIELREIVKEHYLKALELNKTASPENKLSYSMAYGITQDVLIDPDVLEKVNRLRIDLKDQVSELPENWEYVVYERIYVRYLQVKRYEDALRILDEMRERFPKKLDEIIAKQVNVRALKHKASQQADIVESVTKNEETINISDNKKISEETFKNNEPVQIAEPRFKQEYLYILIGVLLLLGVRFGISRLKK